MNLSQIWSTPPPPPKKSIFEKNQFFTIQCTFYLNGTLNEYSILFKAFIEFMTLKFSQLGFKDTAVYFDKAYNSSLTLKTFD